MNQVINKAGKIRLYGTGGFGVNIVKHFEAAAGVQEEGHALPFPCYIDTSRSNLDEAINPEHLFILEDVDGSGKVRKEHHAEISKTIKKILEVHRPMDFNVVVFSASGGSGSVFGPLIVAELLTRGLQVVALVVGSDESVITAQNTINTLKSLDSIAARTELPVVICYEHNEPTIKRSEIDIACRHVIGSLSLLTSKMNAELDSADIGNWVQFSRSTSVSPTLALFDVYHSSAEVEKASQPVAIASLYENTDSQPIAITPEYSCVGYPRSKIPAFKETHFVITLDGVSVISKRMQARIDELNLHRKARVDRSSLVEKTDNVSSDGLIL